MVSSTARSPSPTQPADIRRLAIVRLTPVPIFGRPLYDHFPTPTLPAVRFYPRGRRGRRARPARCPEPAGAGTYGAGLRARLLDADTPAEQAEEALAELVGLRLAAGLATCSMPRITGSPPTPSWSPRQRPVVSEIADHLWVQFSPAPDLTSGAVIPQGAKVTQDNSFGTGNGIRQPPVSNSVYDDAAGGRPRSSWRGRSPAARPTSRR